MRQNQVKTILITGGAGFIGSNFVPYFLKSNPDYRIINLDKLTYAGSLDNLKEIEQEPRHTFVHGDICDKKLIDKLFKEENILSVINFAAESHVDNSIERPDSFLKTNIEGTFTLLEAARHYWLTSQNNKTYSLSHERFHHISTDEVYGSLGATGKFTENSPYAPNSPYSASKASADFLVRSYGKTYGLNVVTTNCSNNYGPKQHIEKLIPTIIHRALSGQNIPIYGKGTNIRDWLFVEDHCSAIEKVFHHGKKGETYLIGADNERNNLSIAQQICEILDVKCPLEKGSYKAQITFVTDRPGHDFRYAVDTQKIERELKWYPETNFITGITKTIDWYLAQPN